MIQTVIAIYVIGLETKFRGSLLLKELASHGFRPKVMFGIDGNEIPSSGLSSIYSESLSKTFMGRSLTLGEIGCYLSHQKVYEEMLQTNIPFALILEDDSRINDVSLILELCREFMVNRELNSYPTVIQLSNAWLPNKFNVSDFRIFRMLKPNRHYGTFGYLLNDLAAEALLMGRAEKVFTTADWPVNAYKVHFWISNKPLVDTTDSESVIGPERFKLAFSSSHREPKNLKWAPKFINRIKLLFRYAMRILGLYLLIPSLSGYRNMGSYLWFFPYKIMKIIRYRTFGQSIEIK